MIKPPKVSDGTVALVSPGADLADAFPHRVERAKSFLINRGYETKEYETTTKPRGYGREAARERAETLMEAFTDPDVDVILPTTGGFRSNMLLPHLDFEQIAENPTVLLGYSDTTALQIAIHERADVVTFQGPTAMPEFGEYPEPFAYTTEAFEATIHGELSGVVEPADEWTNEFLDWETKDDLERPRERCPNPGFEWLQSGSSRGRLIGGNLSTLENLRETEYWPELDGRILLLEESSERTDVRRVASLLSSFRQAGVFDCIDGLVFGRFGDPSDDGVDALKRVLRDLTAGFEFPVLYGIDIGHTDPMLTLPLGVTVTLDAEQACFCVEEEGVR